MPGRKPKLPEHVAGRRLEQSIFFLTINLQKHVKTYGEYLDYYIHLFKRVIKDLFFEQSNQIHVFKNRDDERTREDVAKFGSKEEWLNHYVEVFEFIGAIETGSEKTGEENGRVHAHILIVLRHRTRIQLDYAFINSFIRENMGIKEEIHVYNKLVGRTKDDIQNSINYIQKYAKREYLISPDIPDTEFKGKVPPKGEAMPADIKPSEVDGIAGEPDMEEVEEELLDSEEE